MPIFGIEALVFFELFVDVFGKGNRLLKDSQKVETNLPIDTLECPLTA